MFTFPVRAAAAVCLFLLSAASHAAVPALTLESAVARALENNPELAGFVFESRVQATRTVASGFRPTPQIGLEIEDIGGSGPYSDLGRAQSTLSLSQVLESGGKRGQRSALARAQGSRLLTEQSARQLDVLAEVGRRFIAVLAQQERIKTTRQQVQLATQMTEAVDKRVAAAAAPEVERSRANVALAEAQLALEDAQHRLLTIRGSLAAAIGLVEPDFGEVNGDLYALDPTAPFEELIGRLQGSPNFLWFADEARVLNAQLRLDQTTARRDLQLSFGIRRYEQTDDTALVAGISVPLFAAVRAKPTVDATRARIESLSTRRRSAFLTARAHLHARYQELEHARHVEGVLRDTVLPLLEHTRRLTSQAYRSGRYSYLELSEAQKNLLSTRMRRIDTAAEFQIHRIEIERLTGETLDTGEQL